MNWLNTIAMAVMTPYIAIALMVIFVLSFANEGLRRRLRNQDARMGAMVLELVRLGVKCKPIGESQVGFTFTEETTAFKQAFYIGSTWKLEKILDTQRGNDSRLVGKALMEVIDRVNAQKARNAEARAVTNREDAEEVALAGLESAVYDLAQVVAESEQKRAVDTAKEE